MSAESCCVTCGIVVHADAQVLGGLAPDRAHRLALDLAPAREIRQRLGRRGDAATAGLPRSGDHSRFACAFTSSIEMRPSGPLPAT